MSQRALRLRSDRRDEKKAASPKEAVIERRSGEDRRRDGRVRLSLEVAVPVHLRGPDGVQRGLARNISEGGMLIELDDLPALGSELQVTITGIQGSSDAPDAITLTGEVRHHVAWQYTASGRMRTMRGVGIRFIEKPKDSEAIPTWVLSAGRTIH